MNSDVQYYVTAIPDEDVKSILTVLHSNQRNINVNYKTCLPTGFTVSPELPVDARIQITGYLYDPNILYRGEGSMLDIEDEDDEEGEDDEEQEGDELFEDSEEERDMKALKAAIQGQQKQKSNNSINKRKFADEQGDEDEADDFEDEEDLEDEEGEDEEEQEEKRQPQSNNNKQQQQPQSKKAKTEPIKQQQQQQPQSKPVGESKTINLPSGLKYKDVTVGSGKKADKGNTVSIRYTGKLMNGKVFDSNMPRGQPLRFRIGAGDMIPGFEIGVKGMQGTCFSQFAIDVLVL